MGNWDTYIRARTRGQNENFHSINECSPRWTRTSTASLSETEAANKMTTAQQRNRFCNRFLSVKLKFYKWHFEAFILLFLFVTHSFHSRIFFLRLFFVETRKNVNISCVEFSWREERILNYFIWYEKVAVNDNVEQVQRKKTEIKRKIPTWKRNDILFYHRCAVKIDTDSE